MQSGCVSPKGSEVVFYTIEDAGHTWPGGFSLLPRWLVGKTTNKIKATDVIWEFFLRNTRCWSDRETREAAKQLLPDRHILGCQCAPDGRALTHSVGMIRPSRILLPHVDAHSIAPPVEDKQIRIDDRVTVAYNPCLASHAFLDQGVGHREMFEPLLLD